MSLRYFYLYNNYICHITDDKKSQLKTIIERDKKNNSIKNKTYNNPNTYFTNRVRALLSLPTSLDPNLKPNEQIIKEMF